MAKAEHIPSSDNYFEDEKVRQEFDKIFDDYDGQPGKGSTDSIASQVWAEPLF